VTESWLSALQRRPIIAAVRDEDSLRVALEGPSTVLFLLSATLLNIEQIVHRIRREERAVFVHLDLVEGLSKDQHGVHWLAEKARPTGVISTRGSLLNAARSMSMATVQRVFLLDSQSVRTGLESVHSTRPDVVEVLPGILPGVIAEVAGRLQKPVIAGGMITTIEACCAALRAGAHAVSTSDQRLWRADLKLARELAETPST
jgi:glycerol uptake operon antiterminator